MVHEKKGGAGKRKGARKAAPKPGAAMDIPVVATEQRRIVRQQLQFLIDALPGAFLAVDQQRRICFVSDQVESLFGYRAEELVGQPVSMLVPPELRDRHVGLHAAFLVNPVRRPMGSGLDIHGITKDGVKIPLDIGLSPLPTTDGLLVIAAILDLRPQKQIEISLLAAKAEADRANQMKSRLLAAAGHDLRQPLQTIGLLHGLLEKRMADRESRAILGRLDDTVATMANLLDTLLDIYQIERGVIEPEITDFSVGDLLERKADDFATLAAAKGLTLRAVSSSMMIRSDRHLLQRVVANLLSNAIKYTDHGKILLGCRRRDGKLRIEVWDTGIGIPGDQLKSVFDEFYRIDRADSSKFGLGLGLYFVQRIAALLGHTVEVRSTPGKGTMFALTVSIANSAPPVPGRQSNGERTSKPRILLVEDDIAQLEALRVLLEMDGFCVDAVRSGHEALARLRGPAHLLPDVLVTDYNLPGGMTGLQLIERMGTELGAQKPALIVSGDKSIAAAKAFERSGTKFVGKPVNAAGLLSAIDALVRISKPDWPGRKEQRPAIALPPLAATGSDVAVIDDEPSVRDAFAKMLEAEGLNAATFESAEAFFGNPDYNRFRCLLVDVNLPGMDGFALQNRLKSEQADVPVIFITGSSDLPLAVKAMRNGAADFLQKPVHRAELRDSIARVMNGERKNANHRADEKDVAVRLGTLTEREKQVLEPMLNGKATKNIAADLGISLRTAEHHRQNVMHKMGAKSLTMLIRMVGNWDKIS